MGRGEKEQAGKKGKERMEIGVQASLETESWLRPRAVFSNFNKGVG